MSDSNTPPNSDGERKKFSGKDLSSIRRVESQNDSGVNDLSSMKRLRMKRADLDEIKHERDQSKLNERTEEDAWDKDREKTSHITRNTIISLVALGIAAAGSLIYVRSQKKAVDPATIAKNSTKKPQSSTQDKSILATPTKEEVKTSEAHVAGMETAVKGFINARTDEELIKFVRSPERVGPLMKEFYKNNPRIDNSYNSIKTFSTFVLSKKSCELVVVNTNNGDIKLLLEKLADGRFVVDWETATRYQPIRWEEFLEKRPSGSLNMRVVISPDSFFVGDYTDAEKYAVFKISQSVTEEHVFGYVERNSQLYKDIMERYRDPSTRLGDFQEMMLKLRWTNTNNKFKQVIIEDKVANSWVNLAD